MEGRELPLNAPPWQLPVRPVQAIGHVGRLGIFREATSSVLAARLLLCAELLDSRWAALSVPVAWTVLHCLLHARPMCGSCTAHEVMLHLSMHHRLRLLANHPELVT